MSNQDHVDAATAEMLAFVRDLLGVTDKYEGFFEAAEAAETEVSEQPQVIK